jgi:hypothetical protein
MKRTVLTELGAFVVMLLGLGILFFIYALLSV